MRRKKIIVFTSCHYYYEAIRHVFSQKISSCSDVIYYPVSLFLTTINEREPPLFLWPQADRFIFVLQGINELCIFFRFASDAKNWRGLNQDKIIIIGKKSILSLLTLCYKNLDPKRFISENCTIVQLAYYLNERVSHDRMSVGNRMKSRLARCQMEVLISLLSGYQAKQDAQERNKSIKTIYALRQKALKKLNCNSLQDIYRFL
ncbi:response regulator transcription factor [Brenneria sp. 4F2]|nr:response regulator transcription factor [Brenneria bubanii]